MTTQKPITPVTTIASLKVLKEDMQKQELVSLIDHSYVSSQLGIYFGSEAAEKISLFKSNCLILLNDPNVKKTVAGCDHYTLIQSMINITKDNLSLNPYDQESCVVNRGGKVVASPMVKGILKRLQERGVIRYIDYIEVMYEGDKLTDLGNGRFKHYPLRPRKKDANPLEVLMEVVMADGRPRYKRVSSEAIIARSKMASTKNIWEKWSDEMWKKTAIKIFEAEIGVKATPNSDNTEDVEYQDATYEEGEPEQQPQPETPQPVAQTPELRNKLNNMKGLLPDNLRARLEAKIDTMSDKELQESIDLINKVLADARAEVEKEQAEKNKNESPLA